MSEGRVRAQLRWREGLGLVMALVAATFMACGDDPPSSPGPAQNNLSFRGNGTDFLPRSAFQPISSQVNSNGALEWIDDGGTGDTIIVRVSPAAGSDGSVASSVSVIGPGPVAWTSPGSVVPGVVIGPTSVQFSGVDTREVGPRQTQITVNGLLTTPTSPRGRSARPTIGQE